MVDQLYGLMNRKNKFGIECLFRNHQRIITHIMTILEGMCFGHTSTLPMMAQEVKLVVLMLHEFFNKDHFQVCMRAVLVLGSLMHETPEDKDQKVDYYLRKAQREIAFLKYILNLTVPKVLKKIFDLGLSVELLFSEHMVYTFSKLFQAELALRIRDIYFIFKFYSKINRHKDFSFFMLFKCCVVATILEQNSELLLGLNKGS